MISELRRQRKRVTLNSFDSKIFKRLILVISLCHWKKISKNIKFRSFFCHFCCHLSVMFKQWNKVMSFCWKLGKLIFSKFKNHNFFFAYMKKHKNYLSHAYHAFRTRWHFASYLLILFRRLFVDSKSTSLVRKNIASKVGCNLTIYFDCNMYSDWAFSTCNHWATRSTLPRDLSAIF